VKSAIAWQMLAVLHACCAVVQADVREQGPRDSAPSGLWAGVARADITPPVGIAQMNWGSQTHLQAEGIDPPGLAATALVLSDGRRKFVMVDLDLGGFATLAEDVIPRAASLTGIPAAHIRLAASHTHAGPQLSAIKGPPGADLSGLKDAFRSYLVSAAGRITRAIVEADRNLRPAHLHGGRGIGTININRRVREAGDRPAAVGRNPEGFVDRELIVLRIDDSKGNPYAVLVNFQCHGTVLAYENRLISPDWIGAMRQVVEGALPGALCLFFQGAAGNQGPVEGFTGDPAVARRLGSILGHQAAAVALGIDTVRREPRLEGFVESTAYQARQPWRVIGPRPAELSLVTGTVRAERRRYSAEEIAGMEGLVAAATLQADQAKAAGDPWKQYQAEARVRRFSDLLKLWKSPHDPTPILIPVQVLRIGAAAIASMPGEPFAEIGVAVKKASPFPVTMFCGYSSGEGAEYFPTASEYEFGGYEVQRTPYAPGTDRKIIAEFSRLLAGMR